MSELPELNDEERAIYEWQMWSRDFGEEGQRRLKASRVLVSRCGGVGGTVAYYLAAAGIGKLVLAHRGDLVPSDLNRQLLMTHDWLGKPRIESVVRRLRELNPRVELVPVAENISEDNAGALVEQVDAVASCAPLFTERLAMNQAAVRQKNLLVDAAMFDLSFQLTVVRPGQTACLACLYPELPPHWKRQFPVFGAVSGTVAAMAAMELIKSLAGFGAPLQDRMILGDLRTVQFQSLAITRNPQCAVCGSRP